VATLKAARQKYPNRRIITLFQPHLPSRTQQLMDDFAASFSECDIVLLTDIYLAREKSIPGIDSEVLTKMINSESGRSNAKYVGSLENAELELASKIQAGDIIITMGAGNVRSAGIKLLERKS
jgi:UDP-N-acetylmuramate--alanine ligase